MYFSYVGYFLDPWLQKLSFGAPWSRHVVLMPDTLDAAADIDCSIKGIQWSETNIIDLCNLFLAVNIDASKAFPWTAAMKTPYSGCYQNLWLQCWGWQASNKYILCIDLPLSALWPELIVAINRLIIEFVDLLAWLISGAKAAVNETVQEEGKENSYSHPNEKRHSQFGHSQWWDVVHRK